MLSLVVCYEMMKPFVCLLPPAQMLHGCKLKYYSASMDVLNLYRLYFCDALFISNEEEDGNPFRHVSSMN